MNNNMNIENTIRLMKKVHPDSVVLIKIGKFYYAYRKDACILSCLFDYKIKNDKYKSCGFPVTSLNKVMVELENQKISYLLVDRRDNYEVTHEEDFKKENRYNEVYESSLLDLALKNKIDKLNRYLLDNIENKEVMDRLKKLEEMLYEE